MNLQQIFLRGLWRTTNMTPRDTEETNMPDKIDFEGFYKKRIAELAATNPTKALIDYAAGKLLDVLTDAIDYWRTLE